MTFYEETCERLKGLFNTRHDVIIQVGPIRVAMDTAINSIVEPGDKVIICRNGHWSDQFRILVELSGGEPIIIDDVWGRSFSVDLLRDEIKRYRGQAKALVLTHVETSTGIVNPVAEVGRVARENDLLFILDSAQSLGGMEVRMDEWNVDLCIGGSHKCMSPPFTLPCHITICNNQSTSGAPSLFPGIIIFTSEWGLGITCTATNSPTLLAADAPASVAALTAPTSPRTITVT
jgi:aspartate aminotransferase-like enzyme